MSENVEEVRAGVIARYGELARAAQPGETVLDLGSGGGIDVLLSARRVGPTGKVYGLDATPEMIEPAEANAAEAGASNVEFLHGHIEDMPLPDACVDVVISNCVINLSADKARVLAEAFRVLKPGGRLGVADVIADDGLDPAQRAEAPCGRATRRRCSRSTRPVSTAGTPASRPRHRAGGRSTPRSCRSTGTSPWTPPAGRSSAGSRSAPYRPAASTPGWSSTPCMSTLTKVAGDSGWRS